MLRYKLRTLLIMLAVLPPLSAVGWARYQTWKAEQQRLRALQEPRQQQEVAVQTQGLVQVPLVLPEDAPQASP